jgi:hypothetical protein
MLEAAATDPARGRCVDHADLPTAWWERVVPHSGLKADRAAIERMAQDGGVAPEHRPMTDAIRDAAQRFAKPGYRALASPG